MVRHMAIELMRASPPCGVGNPTGWLRGAAIGLGKRVVETRTWRSGFVFFSHEETPCVDTDKRESIPMFAWLPMRQATFDFLELKTRSFAHALRLMGEAIARA
jgi:hypothetical protein